MDEIASRVSKLDKSVSRDHIIQLMKDAEPEEFMHRVVQGVKFVSRKKHGEGQSDWTLGL